MSLLELCAASQRVGQAMVRSSMLRIIFHGGNPVFDWHVGCVSRVLVRITMDHEQRRFFRQSHLIPIAQGVSIVAIAGILPLPFKTQLAIGVICVGRNSIC